MVCEGAAKGQAFREGASWVNKRLEKRLLIYPWLRELQALNFLPTRRCSLKDCRLYSVIGM